jgi:hypothetical protein
MPRALFVVGNSGLNIRTGQALATEKDKDVTQAVFGQGPKDATRLGAGVYKQYGVAENGFQISSCQFAMHYFFENSTTLHQFLRNLTECTRINGYFIATCYDGQTVFNVLNDKEKGDSLTIMKDGRKMYEITKSYDQTGFPQDEMSLGYAIDVYQESIGKVFREYLVNFEYFTRIMEDYGFILVTKEEAKNMRLPNGSALFSELFSHMENETKFKPKNRDEYGTAHLMSAEERRISFMNRYFIFRKVRNVDVKKMSDVILKQTALLDRIGEENVLEMENAIKENQLATEETPAAIVPKKMKRKLTLKKFEPFSDEPAQPSEPSVQVIESSEPVEVTEFKIIGAPMKLKVKRKP